MSGAEKSPFDQPLEQSWKLDEMATTPEEDAANLQEKLTEYVMAAARFDSYMTPDQRDEDLKLKAVMFGLTPEELESRIEERKAERKAKLAGSSEASDIEGEE